MISICIIAVFGLVVGSFFNVIAVRVPQGLSIIRPRSHCPHCRHVLKFYDLIPVFSYLLLRGKCRSCRKSISPIYPITETAASLMFTYSYLSASSVNELVVGWTLIALLLIVMASDLHFMVISNSVLVFFFFIDLSYTFLGMTVPFEQAILGACIGFLLPLLVKMMYQGGMGGGDLKLFTLLGFILGPRLILLSLALSCLSGIMFSSFLVMDNPRKLNAPFPFAPFICIGTLITFFLNDHLLHIYEQWMQILTTFDVKKGV